QDDAHIFMTPEQIPDEIAGVVKLINQVYTKFGFDYFVELSTRPEDSMGSDEDWEAATEGLKTALNRLNMPYILNEGDGAFYGPKIDFHLRDCLGRTWQCGTIQLDFQMPLNFGLEYVAEDGSRKRPIMIHRVCYGSIERFIGIITEHFAGKFPLWLAPLQVKVLPVSDKSMDYARQVYDALRAAKIRVELDTRNEKIGYKIREARQVDRVPYMLIIGEKEVETGTVSVRSRETDQTDTMTLEALIGKLNHDIAERV
ncbi:MAG: aminoacyl--tRNA ligase-related protein, partial [Candidatus Ventricola sp.]